VRTTYAVVVLPRETAAFELTGTVQEFHRKKMPVPGASLKTERFIIQLPAVEEGFYLTNIDYTPVQPGRRVTAFLEAENFSPQTGVLVNGVPLSRTVAIARPGFVPEATTSVSQASTAQQVEGEYELINPRKMILSFSMGNAYEGTPIISLVTPQKTMPINFLKDLTINRRSEPTSLQVQSEVEPMFLSRLEVTGLELTPDSSARAAGASCRLNPTSNFEVRGNGFRPGAEIWINGKRAEKVKQVSTSRYRVEEFSFDNASELRVLVRQPSRQGQEEASQKVISPLALKVIRQEILQFTDQRRKFDLKLELSGPHADHVTVVRLGSTSTIMSDPLSSTELVLRDLPASEDPVVLKLTDCDARPQISTVLSVSVPEPPAILALVGPDGSASGLTTGNYLVAIQGKNLRDVTRVLFGKNLAAVLSVKDSELIVSAPPGPEGQAPVRLFTEVVLLGRELDNSRDFGDPGRRAYFTYVKPPAKP
jgi:hypothetical protein